MDKSSRVPFLIRSLINYEASKDHSLPAKGYSLHFGEIVAVIDCFDDNWWKVCTYSFDPKTGVTVNLNECGLIPSLKRHNKKIIKKYHRNIEWNTDLTEEQESNEDVPPPMPLEKSKYQNSLKNITQLTEDKTLRSSLAYRTLDLPVSRSNLSQLNNSNNSSVATFSESPSKTYGSKDSVNSDSSLFNRQAYQYVKLINCENENQPLVVLGFLRYRIYEALKLHSENYESVVAHTTRAMRQDEIDGRDYHYTTEDFFNRETHARKQGFIQWGRYRDNLYGTHVSAIKNIINNNKCPLLDITGEALPNLQRHRIYPHVVLIKISSHKWIQNDDNTKSEGQARDLIMKTKRLEELYTQNCTKVIEVSAEHEFEDIVDAIIRYLQDVKHTDAWKSSEVPVNISDHSV